MKPNQDREEITIPRIRVENIRYRSENSDFMIAGVCVVDGGSSGLTNQTITVRGTLPSELKRDDELDLKVLEENHERFGTQYQVTSWGKALPHDEEGLRKYFKKNFTGIGEKRAFNLLNEFGSGVINLLEGDRETAVAAICARLKWTEDLTRKLVKQWQEAILPKKMEFLLLGAGLNNSLITNVKERFGTSFTETIQNNPYKLTQVGGIGFTTADKVALRNGMLKDSDCRVWAAVAHVLLEATGRGDCYLGEHQLIGDTAKLLRIGEGRINEVLKGKFSADEAVYRDEKGNWWLLGIYLSEKSAAEFLVKLMETKSGLPTELSETQWARIWTNYEIETGIRLTDEQKHAVLLALANKVMVITGNPGTGKTTILKAILSAFEFIGCRNIALCAPTGKAARRMAEATGRETSTIHRLFGIGTGDGGFSHLNPLPVDVLVIDEVSMVDISLFATLVSSIKRSAILLLIGDKDQLASVGAGRVLADLLEAEIPHIKLTQPQRQARNSFIVNLAHAVNNGELPELPSVGSAENVWFAPVEDERQGMEALEKLLRTLNEKEISIEKMKSLSPQKKGICGVFELNRYLQGVLNPAAKWKKETIWGSAILREDDLLIQLKNDRALDLMNGEEIRVTALREVEKEQENEVFADVVTENNRALSLTVGEMVMQHSSALTIHKSQGSEWDVIIIFCLPSQMGFYSRKMFYTGLTRARKLAVIIGSEQSLKTVIGRNYETRRKTQLMERIRFFQTRSRMALESEAYSRVMNETSETV